MTENQPASHEVDPQFVIEALMEENRGLNDNRLYLISLVKQLKAEFEQAKATWELERASLKGRE